MEEKGTRDMVIEAITMIKSHMNDCEKYRQIILNTHAEFRDDIKKLNIRMAMILGGLIILSHGIDYILAFFGHAK